MIFLASSAEHLKLKGKKGRYSLNTYPSGEIKINVTDKVNSRHVFIVGSVLSDANSLLEIMILADGLKVKGAKVEIILPYLAYARQDKPEKEEPFAARVVCTILKTTGFERAFVVDAHNIKLSRYFNFTNVIPVDIFAKEFAGITDPVVVAPDRGGIKRAKETADFIGCEIACIEKERMRTGEQVCTFLKGDVRDKNALIVDDIIDSGSTIIKAANIIKERGAKDIYVAASHGLFSGNAIKNLETSQIKKTIVTNTLSLKISSDKIKVVKIEPLIEKIIAKEK
jgi:ribose-phosphate pyrophosphokinase